MQHRGTGRLGARLEAADRVHLLHGEADVVEAVQQAVLAERVHLEAEGRAVVADDLLRGQVDLELEALLRVVQQLQHLVARQHHRQHA